MSVVAQIKAQLPMLEYAATLTELRHTGNDRYSGICPVHPDKNPSFRVNARTNKCQCFSETCQLHHKHGYDVIDLYAMVQGISNQDAIIALRKELDGATNNY
jgi:DNA primase